MVRSLVFFMLIVALVACENTITEPAPLVVPATVVTARNVPADTASAGRYTFYSLRDSALVASTDSNSTKWDIALKGTMILTNSGVSGPGQGGGIVLAGVDFDTLSQAPASGYGRDTSATQLAIKTGSGNGWYNYNFATNIITPIPGRVIAVRTADGKYAKVEILNYYKGAPETPTATDAPRYYTFRYFYQPDGSRNLK